MQRVISATVIDMIHNTFQSKGLRIFLWMILSLILMGMIVFSSIVGSRLYSDHDIPWMTPLNETVQCVGLNSQKVVACSIKKLSLGGGRSYLSVDDITGKRLLIHAEFEKAPNYLLLRLGMLAAGSKPVKTIHVQMENFSNGRFNTVATITSSTQNSRRFFIPVHSKNVTVLISPVVSSSSVARTSLPLAEVAFSKFNTSQASIFVQYLLKYKQSLSLLISGLTIAITAMFLLGLGDGTVRKPMSLWFGIFFVFVFLVTIYLQSLWFGGYDKLQLSPSSLYGGFRIFLANKVVLMQAVNKTGDLIYGSTMAQALLTGKGHFYSWCRMPLYGMFLSIAGLGMLFTKFNFLTLVLNEAFLQIISIGLALSFFYYAFSKITNPWVALLTCGLIAMTRNRAFYIQIEQLMPAVVLFLLAIGCLIIAKYREVCAIDRIPWWYHVLLQIGFSIWYMMRMDIVPAWFAITFLLYVWRIRTWKYILLMLGLYFGFGLLWAWYKYPIIHAISIGTESKGISFWGGLWDVPQRHFFWKQAVDGAYFKFVEHYFHLNPESKAASDAMTKQVFRFYFTFPFYMLSLVWYKFMFFFNKFVLAHIPALVLFTVVLMAAFIRYQPVTLLLLGWPILFNIPIYFLVYFSNGRFFIAPFFAVYALGIAVLFDKRFYKVIWQRKVSAIIAVLLVIIIYYFGDSLVHYLNSASFRYASPFLDPAKSLLNVVR